MKNIENTKIDYLNIGKFVGKTRSGKRLWECRCECGNEFIVDDKIKQCWRSFFEEVS